MKNVLAIFLMAFALQLGADDAFWQDLNKKAVTELETAQAALQKERAERREKRREFNRQIATAKETLRLEETRLQELESKINTLSNEEVEKKTTSFSTIAHALSEVRDDAQRHTNIWLQSSFDSLPFNPGTGAEIIDYQKELLQRMQETTRLGSDISVSPAQAISQKNGEKVNGKKILISQWSALFISDNNSQAGFLRPRQNSQTPQFSDSFTPENIAQVKLIESGQKASLPIDFTEGKALRYQSLDKGILQEIRNGGTTVYPLAILAVFALLIFIAKFFQLYSIPVETGLQMANLATATCQDDKKAAQAIIDKVRGPSKTLMKKASDHANLPHDHLEEILDEAISREIPSLARYLSVLSVSAAAAPLLGLLGTVMGIIKTFSLMSIFGSGNSDMLASGISEALITTKLGLCLAIPCLLAHALLNRRMRSIASGLERSALSFCNALKIDKNDGPSQ